MVSLLWGVVYLYISLHLGCPFSGTPWSPMGPRAKTQEEEGSRKEDRLALVGVEEWRGH